jgi:rhodanese-related sulfurtransferase
MALTTLLRRSGFWSRWFNRRRGQIRNKLLLATLIVVALTAAGAFGAWWGSPTWTQVNLLLDYRFSDVESMSTQQLDAVLARQGRDPTAGKLILLDIRSAEEFAVSRIPGARHVPPEAVLDFAERELASADRKQLIVVYCSVGLRSAVAARDLRFLGFTQVKNLRGSLFQWANERRTLEGGTAVHTYDDYWGRLLLAPVRLPSAASRP